MNELIQKFAKGCTTTDDSYDFEFGWSTHEYFDKEKFAELIVKETMQVVANQLPSNQYLDIAHAVIKHFGVKG
jgi:hypothetical protein